MIFFILLEIMRIRTKDDVERMKLIPVYIQKKCEYARNKLEKIRK